MKFRLLAIVACVFYVLSFTGCNGVGPNETLLARINDESVYEEDLVYLLKNLGEKKDSEDSIRLGQKLYEQVYGGAALLSKILSVFPDLESEWESVSKSLETRWLTILYRNSFLYDCMGVSESVLRQYYNDHSQQFSWDSLMGFMGVRREVAGEYYISVHQPEFEEYMTRKMAHIENPKHEDSVSARHNFISTRRESLVKDETSTIIEKQHFKIAELPPIDPEKYYAKNQDQFMTVPGYELYKVENVDSLALSKILSENVNADSLFRSSAENHLGFVKRGYALPYGIGILPSLDSVLAGKNVGFVTSVFRGANDRFYRFYLAAVVPSQLKPFDRVKFGLEKSIENDELLDVDSSATLIYHEGKPFFTEADLLAFNDEFVKRRMSMRSLLWLTNMLAEHFAFAEAARAMKLDHEWEYRAMVRSARIEFFTERYMDRMSRNVSDKDAEAWFHRVLEPYKPYADFYSTKDDFKLLAAFPENLLKRDYYMGYAVMYKNRAFEQCFEEIYRRRASEYRDLLKKRFMAEAYRSARVHFYNSSITEYKPETYASRLFEKADSLRKAGMLDDAFFEFRTLLFAYADEDSIFRKASYAIAEIHNETSQYLDAEEEYYAFYRIFPNDPNAEKAMFSRAFILNENLKKNKLAEEVLEEFLQTYPNSEFKESAVWLLENIRSNGKLQEELNKKIEQEDKMF